MPKEFPPHGCNDRSFLPLLLSLTQTLCTVIPRIFNRAGPTYLTISPTFGSKMDPLQHMYGSGGFVPWQTSTTPLLSRLLATNWLIAPAAILESICCN